MVIAIMISTILMSFTTQAIFGLIVYKMMLLMKQVIFSLPQLWLFSHFVLKL